VLVIAPFEVIRDANVQAFRRPGHVDPVVVRCAIPWANRFAVIPVLRCRKRLRSG
jgi:hypothetical protein